VYILPTLYLDDHWCVGYVKFNLNDDKFRTKGGWINIYPCRSKYF